MLEINTLPKSDNLHKHKHKHKLLCERTYSLIKNQNSLQEGRLKTEAKKEETRDKPIFLNQVMA